MRFFLTVPEGVGGEKGRGEWAGQPFTVSTLKYFSIDDSSLSSAPIVFYKEQPETIHHEAQSPQNSLIVI